MIIITLGIDNSYLHHLNFIKYLLTEINLAILIKLGEPLSICI